MEEKNGGELLSESTLNNEQLDKATEETVQRIQGVSEGITTPGAVIAKAATTPGASADYEKFINLDNYKKLFGQLETLFPITIIKLRNNLEEEWKKLELSPEEIEAIKKKLDEATKAIKEKNPFTALIDVIGRYKKEQGDINFKDLIKESSASLNATGTFLGEVAKVMPERSAGQKSGKEFVSGVSTMFSAAGEIADGIMSKSLVKTVQGTIKLISSLYSGDKRIDIKIAEEAKELKNLENAYNNLDKAMNRALGEGKYTVSKESLENLKAQENSINRQIALEESKKKTDEKKVAEYENALESVKNKQIDLVDKLRKDLLGTDAKSAAQQLGNAFIEAFGKGEGAVEAFGKKVDDIVGNIIKNMLIQKILEEPIGNILEEYSKKWYDDQGNFSGFDNVRDDAHEMGKRLKELSSDFAKGMEELPDDIKKYFVGPESSGGSGSSGGLAGAIKGASEETVNMAAGQLNAMRINQLEVKEMMRIQLMDHLSTISGNTSYNKYLKSIDERIARMETKDSLRAQGLS